MESVWVMTLFLHWSLSGAWRFRLQGGDDVVADSGSDVTLLCSLKSYNLSVSTVDMEVMWTRPDLNNRVVHHYKNKTDQTGDQDPSYRGRTSLFIEELQQGNTSLLLKKVQWSDQGVYKCGVQGKDATVQLTVEDIGTAPEILVLSTDVSGVISLLCETTGWKFEPEVLWLGSEGNNSLLYKHSGRINVSSIITVQKTETNCCTCVVQEGDQRMETSFNVSGVGTHPEIREWYTDNSGDNSGGVHLLCEIEGWWPEAELQWLDSRRTELYSVPEQTHGDRVVHHITVYRNEDNIYYCRVKQHPMMETHIYIFGHRFIQMKYVIIGILGTGVVVTLVGTFIFLKCRAKGQKDSLH
ncbi:butyrophilin-like protein 10 isoform X1 [Brachyhypopomus gauderio]|uniref:butyrophilin-like protein 10 isoform X1 n=2 Tax=Brachyhypopomus gauderio TaxID=698409 RepID=UPI0040418366